MLGVCDVPGVVAVWCVSVTCQVLLLCGGRDVPGVVAVWWVSVTCQALLLCGGRV